VELFGKSRGDKIIWRIVFALFALSFLLVFSYSVSIQRLIMHTIHLLSGFVIIKIVSKIPYKYFTNFSFILFIVSIVLLFWALLTPSYVLDDFNNPVDASRWINIFGFTFQPSELAKFSLILLLARNLSLNNLSFKNSIIPIFIPVLLIILLTIKSNFSTALIIFFISSILLFISNYLFKDLLKFGGLTIMSFIILVLLVLPFMPHNRVETWKGRVTDWWSSNKNQNYQQFWHDNYQQAVAYQCMSSVGLFSKPGSRNCDIIPKADTDFIYAFAVCEYGLIMGPFILCLYLLFFQRIIYISRRIKSQFPYLLVLGLGSLILVQALINMGVNLSLLPNTGQTLPFLSRGGSSIWMMSLSIGIILNISSVNYEK